MWSTSRTSRSARCASASSAPFTMSSTALRRRAARQACCNARSIERSRATHGPAENGWPPRHGCARQVLRRVSQRCGRGRGRAAGLSRAPLKRARPPRALRPAWRPQQPRSLARRQPMPRRVVRAAHEPCTPTPLRLRPAPAHREAGAPRSPRVAAALRRRAIAPSAAPHRTAGGGRSERSGVRGWPRHGARMARGRGKVGQRAGEGEVARKERGGER